MSASSFQPKKICLHSFPPPPIKKFYIQQKIAPAVLRLTHTLNPPIQTPPLTQHFKTLNPHCWSFRITRNAGGGHIVPTTLQTKKIEGLRRIFKGILSWLANFSYVRELIFLSSETYFLSRSVVFYPLKRRKS